MTRPPEAQDWLDRDGQPISCTGKLRVLRDNEAELRQVMQEACADALLMDVGPDCLRQRMEWLLGDVLADAGGRGPAEKGDAE
ncbi:hypothetical protein NQF87_05260 [Bombella sp. TMW 2.2559]|uniref:Uncharacterized protein n=1 Tax=Bombella dulcis TaxID=2967339 RepID=A0ABT3WBQ9_9PROT|nr:hypothetical protein [Bombella dulcis]MCX5616381.1 hypothetical protein [Bombella dulcis]